MDVTLVLGNTCAICLCVILVLRPAIQMLKAGLAQSVERKVLNSKLAGLTLARSDVRSVRF